MEIDAKSGFYDNAARYTAGLATFHTPARLATPAADLAVAAHRLLGLRDVSRTDAVVTPDGVAHFLEGQCGSRAHRDVIAADGV